jgi:hypothetical protein
MPKNRSVYKWTPNLESCGVPMRTALTPEQCGRMRLFLGAFATYRPKSVWGFVRAWREYQEKMN